jgi:hypothetical protein
MPVIAVLRLRLGQGMGRTGRREVVRRIGRDLRHLHNIDAYAVALIVFVFAVLSVAGDILPANAR